MEYAGLDPCLAKLVIGKPSPSENVQKPLWVNPMNSMDYALPCVGISFE